MPLVLLHQNADSKEGHSDDEDVLPLSKMEAIELNIYWCDVGDFTPIASHTDGSFLSSIAVSMSPTASAEDGEGLKRWICEQYWSDPTSAGEAVRKVIPRVFNSEIGEAFLRLSTSTSAPSILAQKMIAVLLRCVITFFDYLLEKPYAYPCSSDPCNHYVFLLRHMDFFQPLRRISTKDLETLRRMKRIEPLLAPPPTTVVIDGITYVSATPIASIAGLVYQCTQVRLTSDDAGVSTLPQSVVDALEKEKWASFPDPAARHSVCLHRCPGEREVFLSCDAVMSSYFVTAHHCGERLRYIDDFRSPYQILSLPPTIPRHKLLSVRRLPTELPASEWMTVTGGRPNRKYISALASSLPPHHKLFELQHEINVVLGPLFDLIRKERPHIKHFRVGALLLSGQAGSQYDKCSGRLHSDFQANVHQKIRMLDLYPLWSR